MFGERLKTLRIEKGITQQQLANFLNVGRPTISGYETKGIQPDFEKLVLIATFYNVSVDYLLGLTDNKEILSSPQILTVNESSVYGEETRDVTEENKIVKYYNRLNDENKDFIKGQMINLYREQKTKSNLLKDSSETG